MNSAIIELKDVWRIYNLGKVKVPALRGISLAIERGSFTGIIGPSGSGKSTFLNIIGCLDIPTKGEVFLDGEDISKMSENKLAQIRGRKIGFVFQQFNLLSNLTALDNVALPMAFLDIPEKERKKRSSELLEMVGLKERLNHRPSELSGGEQQRIAIARSLANDPEVIVADEPTGNLDSKTGKMIMNIITRLHLDKKKTIIVVTHDKNIVNYSQSDVHIKDGKIVNIS